VRQSLGLRLLALTTSCLLGACATNTPPRVASSPAPSPTPSAASAPPPTVAAAPDDARSMTNPVASSPTALRRGEELFRRHCTACHGAQGRGDGPVALQWVAPPKNLSDPDLQSRLADGEIFWQITRGHRSGTEEVMPSFGDRLSVDDRWKVVLFVRSLGGRR
jgi:mono/diheme cytochrome c family protein